MLSNWAITSVGVTSTTTASRMDPEASRNCTAVPGAGEASRRAGSDRRAVYHPRQRRHPGDGHRRGGHAPATNSTASQASRASIRPGLFISRQGGLLPTGDRATACGTPAPERPRHRRSRRPLPRSMLCGSAPTTFDRVAGSTIPPTSRHATNTTTRLLLDEVSPIRAWPQRRGRSADRQSSLGRVTSPLSRRPTGATCTTSTVVDLLGAPQRHLERHQMDACREHERGVDLGIADPYAAGITPSRRSVREVVVQERVTVVRRGDEEE